MKRRLAVLFTFSLLLFTFQGCGPFWVNPFIEVKPSPLNWIEIHYYNLNRTPPRRIWVSLNGAGHVEVKKGTSELVSNDFARRYDNDDWRQIETHRYDIDANHATEIMQMLVNHGVLDHDKWGKSAGREEYSRFIAVKANISNMTYSDTDNIFEVDPDLAELLLDVIREFNPQAKVR